MVLCMLEYTPKYLLCIDHIKVLNGTVQFEKSKGDFFFKEY